MKPKLITLVLASILAGGVSYAQNIPANVANDFQPSVMNQEGKQFPKVNSERRVLASLTAPGATDVRLDIGGVKYPMEKGADGVWYGISEPQDEGFHYYQLSIDGASVPDPGSLYFYGASRWGSGIEIPAADQDKYALKNVPHGQVRENYYFSSTSNSVRRVYIYTPPAYDADSTTRYPVLYLQHGMGENETGWSAQGHTGRIMDNLIAEGKAKPFIIVMENGSINMGGGRPGGMGNRPAGAPGGFGPGGGAPGGFGPGGPGGFGPGAGAPPAVAPAAAPGAGRPAGGPGGRPAGGFGGGGFGGGFNFAGQFERILFDDLMPYVDKTFRTIPDQAHRAMAGLSMGGMQTRSITIANPEKFSHIGIFSGGTLAPGDISELDNFKKNVKVVFMSYGSREGGQDRAKTAADEWNAIGVKGVSYVSPETAHEWHSWRRSLYQFAQLLFK